MQDLFYILSPGCHIGIPQLAGSILKSFGCLDLQMISPGNSGIDHPVPGIRCHGFTPSRCAQAIVVSIFFNSVFSLIWWFL
jgi:hypothetical protein